MREGRSNDDSVANSDDIDMHDDDDDANSDAASSISSTPIIAIKKAKLAKQQQKASVSKKQTKKPTTARTNHTSVNGGTKNKSLAKQPRVTPPPPVAAIQKSSKPKKNATKQSPAVPKKPKENTNTTKLKTKPKPTTTPPRTEQEPEPNNNAKETTETDDNDSSEKSEEEEAACCLCHCGADCSDRALFFPKDRKSELEEDEDYYFGLDDPYLDGDRLYDRNNALVYCDTCNRLYHQKCHFVPILVVPRGDFHCLICTIQQQRQQQRTPKKRGRKGSIKTKSKSEEQHPAISEKFLDTKITDRLFQTPPNPSPDVPSLQHQLEIESGAIKAKLWDRQFQQLKTFLKSQASNIRMANTTLNTMTSTKRNRQHFLESSAKTGTKASQELAQTLCKLTGAKLKIREALLSLESFRTKNESICFSSLYAWCEEYPQHAGHVFPFGPRHCKDKRRYVPRTRERTGTIEKPSENVPSEILLNAGGLSPKKSREDAKAKKASARSKKGEKTTTTQPKGKKDDKDNDDDSGITLDDLKCSICMVGDATDDNDVILCDGKDCHRAYHMNCVYPAVKPEDIENEDEDWFCPICYHSAELMSEIHQLCVGDDDDDEASSSSWEEVHDVFPDSQWEYETALKFSKGKRNEDTQRLLAMFLGEDIHDNHKVQMPIGSDSEDENDYSLFDEDSFQERRRQEKEEYTEDEASVASSEATLQQMDGVDYRVGKGELAALSEEECTDSGSDEDDDEDDASETKVRRSRRLGKKEEEGESSNQVDVGADFDEANIIEGKRRRKRVNYRKLNDMMFGDLTDHQQGIIDGGDDFDARGKSQAKEDDSNGGSEKNDSDNNSENDDSNNDDSENNESENESGDDESEGNEAGSDEDESDDESSEN